MNTFTKTLAPIGASLIEEDCVEIEELCFEDLLRSMEITGEIIQHVVDYSDPLTLLMHKENQGFNVFHDTDDMVSSQFPYYC